MFKDFLIVGFGSFFGGGLRFLVSKGMAAVMTTPFPMGTFTVNVLGCLLIGFFSSLPVTGGWMSPSAKLLLTTGFCGGFTTFSTFMGENSALMKGDHFASMILYLFGSLAIGLLAVLAGHALGKLMG